MKILGIETSCDETAAAVVEDGCHVRSNVIASQAQLHARTGGVVPEIAAREHVTKIIPVIEQAFSDAGCGWHDIDAIAVTKGPGLMGCLLTGTNTGSALALTLRKPLIPVSHIKGHLYSNWLGRVREEFHFPMVILTVSGGHNEIVLMRDYEDFAVLGKTRDDAAGEAFDKVARILGLGYPGGPEIAKAALQGDAGRFDLPRSMLEEGSLDFSFSGLKTAVMRLVKSEIAKQQADEGQDKTEIDCLAKKPSQLAGGMKREHARFIADTAAAFQEAVCEVLAAKVIDAAKKFSAREVHLVGGVSANLRLREIISEGLQVRFPGLTFRFPHNMTFCTDNAAMIAAAGFFQYQKDPGAYKRWQNVVAESGLNVF